MSAQRQGGLGRHLVPEVSEARLARQWDRVSTRRSVVRRRVALGVLVAAAAIFAIFVGTRHGAPAAPASLEGVAFETRVGGESVLLPDGSRAVLDPDSRITLAVARPDDVRVVLDRGGVDLEVTHVEGRRFLVVAAGHAVQVVGTHLSVRVGRALEVVVTRGRVRVERLGTNEARELGAGETWSVALAPEPPVPPSSSPIPDDEPPLPTPSATPSAPHSPVAPARVNGPRELLARAEAAQSAGRTRDAAAAFDELRRRYRGDARAGLAAFELGRLRLDALGDPAGAAEALADAIALAPSAPFREDAEARRVAALDAMGSMDQCREARAAYLTRYPQGLHRAELARRCR